MVNIINHAKSLAASGDTIRVAAATYTENLTIGKSLKLIGAGANTTIIDGGGVKRVVTISNAAAHVTVSKLTIRNGQATFGGGINNSGAVTLTNSTVSWNLAPIPCLRSFVFCQIWNGTALGGGILNSGALIISNSTIRGNHAGSYCNGIVCSAFGGGIYNQGTLMMIKSSTPVGNSAGIASCTLINPECRGGFGGAFYTFGFGAPVMLNNSTVVGNSAYRFPSVHQYGGAIFNSVGNLAMNNSTVSANSDAGIVRTGQRRSKTALSRTMLAKIVGTLSLRMAIT